ncbi:hypothetical protein BBH88_12465 [Planococcus antarcticus DSM 14505]|uniref:Uncharacterized protein n=1 Tax=Planococcus antarcticus DSM 14505 TaxID=1185653 RepID=A0ABN4RG92_9BACL|nr:hypothetical protein [Planococcus antarcticus]ANU11053.1 hypothetical protein BBH88_12465 [Planococcus antarcticus DSM 14505]
MTNGIVNRPKEADSSEKHAKFNEELHNYLLNQEGNPAQRYGLLLNLDPYSDRLFSSRDLYELVIICERLLNEYSLNTNKRWEVDKIIWGINKFAEDLKTLCLVALEQNKKVFAADD